MSESGEESGEEPSQEIDTEAEASVPNNDVSGTADLDDTTLSLITGDEFQCKTTIASVAGKNFVIQLIVKPAELAAISKSIHI